MVTSYQEWLRVKKFSNTLNDTTIILIPKKESSLDLRDLRSTSVCNVLYKILVKVLANRFKVLLLGIISSSQFVFVPGKLISDNDMVAFEFIHFMKRKKRSKKWEVALKININKAYDRVDQNFLKLLMLRLGFNSRWVILCVSTVRYFVALNGEEFGPITLKKGLQQGDPLSPFLFILYSEGLTALFHNAERLIHGIRICRWPLLCPIFFLLMIVSSFSK